MRSSHGTFGPPSREFGSRPWLAVARDVAIILACVALLVAFVAEIWGTAAGPRPGTAAPPRRPPPAAAVAPTSAV